jgi:hypothetical protein
MLNVIKLSVLRLIAKILSLVLLDVIMLSVYVICIVKLSVLMLVAKNLSLVLISFIMLILYMLCIIMLSVIVLNVIQLSVFLMLIAKFLSLVLRSLYCLFHSLPYISRSLLSINRANEIDWGIEIVDYDLYELGRERERVRERDVKCQSACQGSLQ